MLPEIPIEVTGFEGSYCETETFIVDVACPGFITSSHGTPDTQAGIITFAPGDLPIGGTTVTVFCTGAGNCTSEDFQFDVDICPKPTVTGLCRDFTIMQG